MHTSEPQRLLRDGGGPPTRARSAEIHLRDRLSVFFRYRYVAILAFLLVVVAAGLRAYSQTPMYRASVRLQIDLEDERSLTMEGVSTANNASYMQDPEPYFQTQYRILTGRDLARRVVARIKGTTATAVDDGQIGDFSSRISVEPVRASRLVDVLFVSPDPALAAASANMLAEEYVLQNLDLRRQNMERSLEWLAQELARQKKIVEASERAMAQYREEQNALSLEDRQNIVISRLNQLNEAATRARTSRAQKESLYQRLESLGAKTTPDSIPEILQNSYIQSLKAQLAELERRKALLSERYGDKHPEMLTVNASIQDATRQLNLEIAKAVDSIRHDYESALLEERTLATALEEQKGIATDLDRKSVTYTVLQRDAESNRELYQTLLRREKELQVLANSRGNNVRLVERANVPGAPFSPNLRRAMMLGAIVAFLVAVGLVLALDYLDDTIKTPEDITRLGLPFLALIPAVRSGRERPTLSGHNDFASQSGGPAARGARLVDHDRRLDAAEPLRASFLRPDGGAARASAARPVRLGDRRHASGACGHGCVDSDSMGLWRRVHRGLRDDAPEIGGTSDRNACGRATAHPRRRAQPRGRLAQQVLLRTALRLRQSLPRRRNVVADTS
jgi:succinoglycan biosynthesis transport protein ExoP